MKALSSSSILGALLVLLSACAPELNLSAPPDLNADERFDAFENPTAVVAPQIMAEVADQIAEFYDEVEPSSFYVEILEVIATTQEELYNEDGEVDLGGGVTFESPNGGVTVDYICEGWGEPPPTEPDPEDGSMTLDMRLANGTIDALVWGTVDACKYPLQVGPARFDAVYDGDIAIYFEDSIGPEDDVYALSATFLARGSVTVDGTTFPIDELFQVVLELDENRTPSLCRLNLLVELPDGDAFVYSFDTELGQQLTDATGTVGCSLLESRCFNDSGTLFSW